MNCPVITTNRLRLRPVALEDCEQLHVAYSNWKIVSHMTSSPWPFHVSDTVEFLQNAEQENKSNDHFILAIEVSGQPVGIVTAWQENGKWWLAYWLGEAHWRVGYMREAVLGFCNWLYRTHGVIDLHAWVNEGNEPSYKLLKSLDFFETGFRETHSRAHNRAIKQIRFAIDFETQGRAA
ncbi:MAG: hypothetical protein COB90_01615 [Hyphomicrobiales bacterium]|nr:MAG: hypothetical protein COB90_01615 [Hyphomicrobiales bacterium]